MRSLSSRFISIFIVLVLVTTLIFGALFVRFVKKYDIELVVSRVDHLAELILPKLTQYDDLSKNSEFIDEYIGLQSQMGFREQIFVVSKNNIVASSSSNRLARSEDILDTELIILSESGEEQSKICSVKSNGNKFRTYDKAFPIEKNNKIIGVLYIKYDLEDIDKSSSHSIKIIIQSLILSLGFSLILAIFIAGSVTKPINKLTKMASEIAMGNFDEKIIIKSDDEIGKLSSMFNHMAQKLSMSIDETQREKNKMETIVNNIVDGIIAVDCNGEILHMNPSAKTMIMQLSIDPDIRYKKLSKDFPDSLSFENLIKLENEHDFREILNAEFYSYEARCEHFYDERGNMIGFILIFQDITKEVQLENMRRDFIANVSHELKTPITSIKSYSETMIDADGLDQDTSKSFLSVINSEADRMSALVNDLLQLSSLDAGKVELDVSTYTWNIFLKNILTRFEVHFNKKGISCEFIEEDKDVLGEFDYDKMEQVINNLITNSIKYSEKGGQVIIRLKRDASYAIVSVEDNGIGISEDDIDKLFNRFYRVEKSRQRKAGGSGLGLSIAKHILDLHSAEIEVKSKIKEGSIFTIKVPLKII